MKDIKLITENWKRTGLLDNQKTESEQEALSQYLTVVAKRLLDDVGTENPPSIDAENIVSMVIPIAVNAYEMLNTGHRIDPDQLYDGFKQYYYENKDKLTQYMHECVNAIDGESQFMREYIDTLKTQILNDYYQYVLSCMAITNQAGCIKYMSHKRCPDPYHTNINIYHLPTTNQYVMEFPGSGSVWQMIDEDTAKSYIDNSTIDEEYTKWLEQLKNK